MVIVFDLDDTLYDEVDFVKSGFREVSNFLGNEIFFEFMWETFLKEGSRKIFNKLIQKFNLHADLSKLIEIYRFHYPDIRLPVDAQEVLKNLKKKSKLALITDGHYVTQTNKFKALGLSKYIDFPVFTDALNSKKPSTKPFLSVSEIFGTEETYVYIADNPQKDFLAPQNLGWLTIRYKNPRGIYKDIKNNADIEIKSLREIERILLEL